MLRVGTRGSELALWQARQTMYKLLDLGVASAAKMIKSFGDVHTEKPIYEYGIRGVFTRSLDMALLNDEVDLAVHSLKDVPTILPKGLVLAAVLERGPFRDVVVKNPQNPAPKENEPWIIATSSLRRKAQWKHKFPNTEFALVRGNIQTRLNKLMESNWHGIIMAEAALRRLNIWERQQVEILDWMIPAPSQGAVGIVCREDRPEIVENLNSITHKETEIAVHIERKFLRTLESGCSAPVGANALVENDLVHFEANVLSVDGKECITKSWTATVDDFKELGEQWANEMIAAGGKAILLSIQNENQG